MIIDAFIVSDEMALVDFRLEYLSRYVGKFHVVEAAHTFTGESKPLHFTEALNAGRFDKYKNQIIVSYPDLSVITPEEDFKEWSRETKQRNHFAKGFQYQPSDTVMMSDIDEIPDNNFIRDVYFSENMLPLCLRSWFFYYSASWVKKEQWPGTILASGQQIYKETPQKMRNRRWDLPYYGAGWHFSYFGGVQLIKNKIATFSHYAYNREPYNTIEHIKYCIASGKDLFLRGDHEDCLPFQRWDLLPQLILSDPDKYGWMITGEEP